MDRMTEAEWSKLYDRTKHKMHKELRELEADYKKHYRFKVGSSTH